MQQLYKTRLGDTLPDSWPHDIQNISDAHCRMHKLSTVCRIVQLWEIERFQQTKRHTKTNYLGALEICKGSSHGEGDEEHDHKDSIDEGEQINLNDQVTSSEVSNPRATAIAQCPLPSYLILCIAGMTYFSGHARDFLVVLYRFASWRTRP